jgi:hypothetical protein
MRFKTPKCPECGELAKGTVDTIPGCALLTFAEDGSAEYFGETEVFWDGQTTMRVGDALVLHCDQGHDWPSEMTEDE